MRDFLYVYQRLVWIYGRIPSTFPVVRVDTIYHIKMDGWLYMRCTYMYEAQQRFVWYDGRWQNHRMEGGVEGWNLNIGICSCKEKGKLKGGEIWGCDKSWEFGLVLRRQQFLGELCTSSTSPKMDVEVCEAAFFVVFFWYVSALSNIHEHHLSKINFTCQVELVLAKRREKNDFLYLGSTILGIFSLVLYRYQLYIVQETTSIIFEYTTKFCEYFQTKIAGRTECVIIE